MVGVIYPFAFALEWGRGWLYNLGFIDFAGSWLIHLLGGIYGLIAGPRIERFKPIRDIRIINPK